MQEVKFYILPAVCKVVWLILSSNYPQFLCNYFLQTPFQYIRFQHGGSSIEIENQVTFLFLS